MLFSTLAGSSYAPANGAQELQFLLFFFPDSLWLWLFTQLRPALCDSVDYSTSGFPVLHFLLEFAQTHVR